jgi:hypothetical protein
VLLFVNALAIAIKDTVIYSVNLTFAATMLIVIVIAAATAEDHQQWALNTAMSHKLTNGLMAIDFLALFMNGQCEITDVQLPKLQQSHTAVVSMIVMAHVSPVNAGALATLK